ncbi:MAG: MMPL family transporter [Parasporobacterium sp.]|nr:MMPL family transporter [Parasporobacterium sp.]
MNKISAWIVNKRILILVIAAILCLASVYGIFKVNINYDMSEYLPKDSQVKSGMGIMKDEFGEMSQITVMFDDLDTENQLNRKDELSEIENVRTVVYFQNDEFYQKDNHSRYVITVDAGTYSDAARKVLDTVRDKYGDSAYLSGEIVDNKMMLDTLSNELPLIVLIVAVIVFIILFIFCRSWIEPIIYLVGIAVAILFNMGSNALLGSVSFMTFAIAALLQLGLSMDYTIMLMNRYNHERQLTPDPAEAMKKALAASFSTVSGSSVTTIAGLLMLLFMSFRIGADMGIVLAKGILMSLICIFTVLPCLTVVFDKLIQKTQKKSFRINFSCVLRKTVNARIFLIAAVVIIAVGAFFIKGNLGISYIKSFDNTEQEAMEAAFGADNQMVLLYENTENTEGISEFISRLEADERVNYVQDYSNTLGKTYTYQELSAEMGLSESQARGLFQLYASSHPESDGSIEAGELLRFVDEEVLTNPMFSMMISEDIKAQISSYKEMLGSGDENSDPEAELLKGIRYNRMIISADLPAETSDTFEFVDYVNTYAAECFDNHTYLVGNSPMAGEMNNGFGNELNLITLLTIAAVFIVVLITFRSLTGAVLLVVLIQAAVFITTAIVCLQGYTINYISLILVQCIMMGATIDYGILLMDNYRNARMNLDKEESLKEAMNMSVRTILTSSLILITSCVTVSVIMTQKTIAQTCLMIAYGTCISVILVLIFLPCLMYVLDRFIIKKPVRIRKAADNSNAAVPGKTSVKESKASVAGNNTVQ